LEVEERGHLKKKSIYRIYQEMWCSDDCGFVGDDVFHSIKECRKWIKENLPDEPRDFIKYEIYKFIEVTARESDEIIAKANEIAGKKGRIIINQKDIDDAKKSKQTRQ
jgi:histone H3/H4